jgi:hypothetical protein
VTADSARSVANPSRLRLAPSSSGVATAASGASSTSSAPADAGGSVGPEDTRPPLPSGCVECGNDDATEGYAKCLDCLEATGE